MTVLQQSEPLKEFLVWEAGPFRTTYNDDTFLTPELLVNTYLNFQKLGRRLSLDKGHNVSDESLPITQRVSIGTYNLELRNNNTELWAVDVVFNSQEIEYKASKGFFGIYISQEFTGLDVMGNPVRDLSFAKSFDINRITLTDDPATIDAKPVIKLSRYQNKVFKSFRKLARLERLVTNTANTATAQPRVVIDCMPFKNRSKHR